MITRDQLVIFRQIFYGLSLFACLILSSHSVNANDDQAAPGNSLKETEFLGLKLIEADINKVRAHLWDIGGFLQAKTTIRQRNIDKFFTWSTIQDSYHVVFRYNHAGKVVSVKRLYRPYSTENSNRRTAISTREVALKLIEQLGQPSRIETKGWGGMPSYPSYTWQDESMKVVVDREGSEYLGNVFVKYTVKTQKPYAVDKNDQAEINGAV